MAHHTSYPASFPVECVSDLISIVRGGMDEVLARRSEVALHSWNVAGFALSVTLGNPDGPFHAASSDDEANMAESLNTLNAACCECCAMTTYSAAIDWKAALKFFIEVVLPILLPLILKDNE